jgi:CDP-diacylglycerol--glycerol-3-phosphate 3-phosphatidyltransferase
MNLPNRLTLARILLSPVLAVLLLIENPAPQIAAIAVFLIAALTDLLDGRLARSMNLITDFGKLMDPIADKILVMIALVALCAQSRVHPSIAMITLAREFIISGVRIAAAKRDILIAADAAGKLKTVVQMIALPLVILSTGAHYALFSLLYWPAQGLLYLSALLSVWSLIQYVLNNREVLKNDL